MKTSKHIERYLRELLLSGASELTVKNYQSDLNSFDRWLLQTHPKLRPSQLNLEKILTEYAEELSGQYKPATIERRLHAIGSFFDYIGADTEFIVDLAGNYKPDEADEREMADRKTAEAIFEHRQALRSRRRPGHRPLYCEYRSNFR